MNEGSKVNLTKWPHELVTTSNDAWHSEGITSVTVYATEGLAVAALAKLGKATPGKGAFVRCAPQWEVSHEWVDASWPMLRVTVRGPGWARDREFSAKAVGRARKVAREDGLRAARISSGATVTDRGARVEHRFVYAVRAGE
ncbi:hypothetical protein [Streptomyces sp. MP131-18]|uniref:hypothetical protein n=1 Tax=Streptomyces sp. MP131-18 TaxID=1857892 RepID=UPI00097C9BDF|nr:hypothetical protein [Streptomyces sp. MP131-18]ONK10400.1 hypothetical protein STBA_11220 [Streptomyces sp. MP131-18]